MISLALVGLVGAYIFLDLIPKHLLYYQSSLPLLLHWCGIDVPYWLYCINWRVAMAELTRTWMTHWLTWREHRASSWSTSTAFHPTGGWWWRYSLCWWCSSWSSYSSSLDLLYHSARDALAAMRSILLFLLISYYTVYTIFTLDDKQSFTLLWSCKLGGVPVLIRYSWLVNFMDNTAINTR